METITKVAIVIDAAEHRYVLSEEKPARHADLFDRAAEHLAHFTIVTEGFMTSNNRFVDRSEGARIAAAANQIISNDFNPSCLYSEDLW